MRSLPKTSLKLASLLIVAILGAATTAMAQNAKIETSQLNALAAKASETVDMNFDESLLQFTAKFLKGDDPDEKKAKELVNGLKGIYVRSFEFETEGQYSDADLESIRSQLRNPAWNRIVSVQSKKDGSVEVYLLQIGGKVAGLAVLAHDAKEITVVNIVGNVDLDKLSDLEGRFGIPDLDIKDSKPKTKN